jgi:hypothetical protein
MRKLFFLMLCCILITKIANSQIKDLSKKDSLTKDTISTKIDTNLLKVDTSLLKIDSSLLKIDSTLPKIDTNLPQVDTKTIKPGTKTTKAGTKTIKPGTKTIKPGTKTPKAGTKTPKAGTKTPKNGIKPPVVDSNLVKTDTSSRKDGIVLPKTDTSSRKTGIVLPKTDTTVRKTETDLPKTDTTLRKVDTELPKTDTSRMKDKIILGKTDTDLRKEDTSKYHVKIGLGPGISKNFIQGNYSDPGGCGYLFTKGSSYDTSFNIIISIPLDSTTELYFMTGYKIRGLKMTTEQIRPKTIRGEKDKIPVNMEAEMNAHFTYVDFDIFLKKEILFKHFYLMAGVNISYNLKNELIITEQIKDDRYLFGDTYLPWGYLYPKSDFPEINSLKYSVSLGINYEIMITDHFAIAPTVIFSYPFTTVDKKNTLKLSSLSLNLNFLGLF